MLTYGLQEEIAWQLEGTFTFERKVFEGLKYLGFVLNQNDYNFKDWVWMVRKSIQEYIHGPTGGSL
jgi:hypothetical protein